MPTKDAHKTTIQLPSPLMVKTLQGIAKRLGYTQTRGPSIGEGSVSQLMTAIADHEIELRLSQKTTKSGHNK